MVTIQERKLNKTGRMRNKGRNVGIVEYQCAQVGMLIVFGRGVNGGGHENTPHIGACFHVRLENLLNTKWAC